MNPKQSNENSPETAPLSGRFYLAMTFLMFSAIAIFFQEYSFLINQLGISLEESDKLIEFIEYLPITVIGVSYAFLILEFFQSTQNRKQNKSSRIYLIISSILFVTSVIAFLVQLEINKFELKYYIINLIPFCLGYLLFKTVIQHFYRYRLIVQAMYNNKYSSIVKIVTKKELLPVNIIFTFFTFVILLALFFASEFLTISYFCFAFGAGFKLLYSSIKYYFHRDEYLFLEKGKIACIGIKSYNSYLSNQIMGSPFFKPISFDNYLKINQWQKEIIKPYFDVRFLHKATKKINDSYLYFDSPNNISVHAILPGTKYKFTFSKEEFNDFAKKQPIDIKMNALVAYNMVIVRSPFWGKIIFKICGELKTMIWAGVNYSFNHVIATFFIYKKFPNMKLKDKIFCLEQAICYDDKKIIKFILDNKFDLNGKCSSGWTALQCAVAEKKHKIAKRLLKLGASPNTSNLKNITPLHFAVKYNDLQNVKLLFKYGAELDCQTIYGDTPLMLAISNENKQIIDLLIDNGANILLKDSNGKTAEDYAREQRRGDLALLLNKKSKQPT